MGEIVAAAAAVHAPQILSRPDYEELDKLDISTAALNSFGQVLEEVDAEALIVIGTDHLEAFWLEAVPTFLLFVGDHAEATYTTQTASVPVHTELARGLLEGCVAQGFDLAYSQEAKLGHAFLTPFEHVRRDLSIPVVPLLVNVYLPPLPTPRRCFALGQAMRAVIDRRPERVAVLASGGMSHFPGTSKYYEPNFEFDRWVIQEIERGNWDDLLDLTPVQLDEVGEGELLTWFVMLGMVGKLSGTLRSYQATSHHGQGVIQFLPPGEAAASSDTADEVPRYGGHEFTFADYEYYRFPSTSSFALNKVLHRIITDSGFRSSFARDPDAELAASALRPDERDAFGAEGFDLLVEAGAHPLLALSAWQVLKNERAGMDAQSSTTSGNGA